MSQNPDDQATAGDHIDIDNADGVFALLQRVVNSHIRIMDGAYEEDDDDDENDEDYEEVHVEHEIHGDEEVDDDDEEEEEEEEEEVMDDDDDVDEGTILPHGTQQQFRLLLQGGNFGSVLLDFNEWGGLHGRVSAGARRRTQLDPNRFPKVPSAEGRELMDSGVFGVSELPERVHPTTTILDMAWDEHAGEAKARATRVEARRRSLPLRLLDREMGRDGTFARRAFDKGILAQSMVPGTAADMVLWYDAAVYLGQFSDDGNFFYSATKDFRVRMYDTSNINEWHHYKTAEHPMGRWTMTDASLSPDNRWLAFTSMMPQVCLAPTDPNDKGEPYLLDLAAGQREPAGAFYDGFCIFSVRFSGDGRELVAGTNDRSIIVYDIESRQVLHRLQGHDDDVNAVCFGDKTSPHILYSGSDDATIKVWDRRSLGNGRPIGGFVGHCEGITYIDSKGDGRYILSNGKDQTARLWDLRKVMSYADFEAKDPGMYTRHSMYDYRHQRYADDDFFKHKYDNSVVTFRGHRVERTLLRCHFSPAGSSDGRYVYSASRTGEVYIWNMDATLAGVIDVGQATKDVVTAAADAEDREAEAGGHSTPHAVETRRRDRLRLKRATSAQLCVRDASWHPTEPVLVASSFNADTMQSGMCSVHSCDLAADGDLEDAPPRLFNAKMKPMSPYHIPEPTHMRWY